MEVEIIDIDQPVEGNRTQIESGVSLPHQSVRICE